VDAYHILEYALWDFRVLILDHYAGTWGMIPLEKIDAIIDQIRHPRPREVPMFKKIDWQRTYDQVLRHGWLLPLAAS
jgi:hypothetical protein